MNTQISIVIPVYNRAEEFRRCISSLFNQGDVYIEVIVIDDGSDDDMTFKIKKIIEEAKKNRMLLIKYKKIENRGPGGARNEGVKMVSSNYLLFLDSDDTIETGCIAKAMNYIRMNTNIDVLIGRSLEYGSKKIMKPYGFLSLQDLLHGSYLDWQLPVNAAIIKTEVVSNKIFWREYYECFEDSTFFAELFRKVETHRYYPDFISYVYLSSSEDLNYQRVSFKGEESRKGKFLDTLVMHFEDFLRISGDLTQMESIRRDVIVKKTLWLIEELCILRRFKSVDLLFTKLSKECIPWPKKVYYHLWSVGGDGLLANFIKMKRTFFSIFK